MILRRWMLWAGGIAVVLLLVLTAYLLWDRRKYDGIEGRYDDAKDEFFEAETVYVERRGEVIRLRETLRITDTIEVRAFVNACTNALTACDTALAKARTAIATGDSVIRHLKRGPFLETYGAVLYDPVARIPTARIGVNVKPRSKVSLLLEGEQRMEPGEPPRANLGVRVRF